MSEKAEILFSCVTAEVVKVIEPIRSMDPGEVHLFRYIDPRYADSHKFNNDCFLEVREILRRDMPWITVRVHESRPVYEPVALFNSLYRTLQEVHRRRPEVPVHFNISSGTHEFALVTGWLVMFDPLVNIYSVSSREFAFTQELLEKHAYIDGHPQGLTLVCSNPHPLVRPTMFDLQENHLRALAELKKQQDSNRPVDNCSMMERLVWAGICDYDLDEGRNDPGHSKKVSMYYNRNYLEYWRTYGWVEKKMKSNGVREQHYSLTENGEKVLEMFRDD